MRQSPRSFERAAVFVVILATHVLLIEFFFRQGRTHLRLSAADTDRIEVFFIDEPPIAPSPPESSRAVQSARTSGPRVPPEASRAITLPEEPLHPKAPVDWYDTAEQVARDALAAAHEPGPRALGEQPQSPYRRRKHKSRYQWEPEEKKAGFAGPLPYLRLGKRCLVVPPLFACALGKLPKPAGATLKDIRDPDRPESSVPDLDE